MFGDLFDKTIEAATQPIHDGANVIEGLTEGEIRTAAAARLGADVIAGMTISEIIDYLQDNE